MPNYQMVADQVADGSGNLAVLEVLGATTISKVRLHWYQWFSWATSGSSAQPPQAPPNLIIGWGLVSHGGSVPEITTSNFNSSPFIQGGYGGLEGSDSTTMSIYEDWTNYTQTFWGTYVWEGPLYQASDVDLFLSYDWLATDYYHAGSAYLTYEVELWSNTD